jgi:hypothetical protein
MSLSLTIEKIARFWHRYENLNLKLAFFLISLQLLHLYWLTTDVVVKRVTGQSAFAFSHSGGPVLLLFVFIDYIEVPALVAGLTYYSLIIYRHREGSAKKNALFLAMLAVQVFHIFWISDEVVYSTFFSQSKSAVAIPYFAAWIAILIDYLELPVMGDLFYKTFVKGERR